MITTDPVGLYNTILAKLLDARVKRDEKEASRIKEIQHYYLNIRLTDLVATERTKLEFISLLRGDITLDNYIQIKRELSQQQTHNPRQENLNL